MMADAAIMTKETSRRIRMIDKDENKLGESRTGCHWSYEIVDAFIIGGRRCECDGQRAWLFAYQKFAKENRLNRRSCSLQCELDRFIGAFQFLSQADCTDSVHWGSIEPIA